MGSGTGKIGLFGGSFDPVHLGHLIIASDAREQAGLEAVWFLPAGHSPLKDRGPLAPGAARREMLCLATSTSPFFKVEGLELEREGKSFSVDTVEQLQGTHADTRFFWILGADQFARLGEWHEVERLCERVTFLVTHRPGGELREPDLPGVKLNWQALQPRYLSISSTEIRDRIAANREIHPFLNPAVAVYIETHRLYHSNPSRKMKTTPYGS